MKKIKAIDDSTPMSVKGFVEWCNKSKQRHIHIIGDWAETTEPNCLTRGQWQSFIKRNLRAARLLSPYNDQQIGEAFQSINRADYLRKFTLETMLKYIDYPNQ